MNVKYKIICKLIYFITTQREIGVITLILCCAVAPVDGSAERYDIAVALEGLRGVIEEVERCVGDYERAKKLQDIISRLDNKSCTRLKNGEIFSKQDLQKAHLTLTHSSALTCRTTSGRLRGPTDMCFYFLCH